MTTFVSKNICPITHIPVTAIYKTSVPVLAPDGHTYEKEAIEYWIASHGNSPVTRQQMSVDQLIVNRALIGDDEERSVTRTVNPIEFVLAAGLDNSGSMDEVAEIVDSSGARESHGLTQLDLAKHSLVTTVESLNETCMFGLVVWSSTATIALPLIRLDEAGKKKAIAAIKKVTTDGSTNLWEGIRQTQRVCDTPIEGSSPRRCTWILSDGQPNYHPPKSYPEMLTDYNRDFGTDRELRMIGYGYNIDSELMSLIAKHDGGSFSFIPDPGFVGTVVVHSLANSMEVTVEAEETVEKESRIAFVNCLESILNILVTPKSRYGSVSVKEEQLIEARKMYDYYTTFYVTTKYNEKEIIIALDSIENWKKWGGHYVRALSFSHTNQECTNFKDPSVQGYQDLRKERWRIIRDLAHEVYKNLPAPEPSRVTAISAPRLTTMNTYSQSSNGCLHESALVELSNGKSMACSVIAKGTVVNVYDTINNVYYTDKIQCVVRTKCGECEFSAIKSTTFATPLHITPWHPVFYGGAWKYPGDFCKLTKMKSKYVYSFVLAKRSAGMMISGHPCISLASFGHDFWGTEKVVSDLKKLDMPGWCDGLVTLTSKNIKRNEEGDVVAIEY